MQIYIIYPKTERSFSRTIATLWEKQFLIEIIYEQLRNIKTVNFGFLVLFFLSNWSQIFRHICWILGAYTGQKMKFLIKDFFSKCDQICRFLRMWSYSLKKSLMGNFIFDAVVLVWLTPSSVSAKSCFSHYQLPLK